MRTSRTPAKQSRMQRLISLPVIYWPFSSLCLIYVVFAQVGYCHSLVSELASPFLLILLPLLFSWFSYATNIRGSTHAAGIRQRVRKKRTHAFYRDL